GGADLQYLFGRALPQDVPGPEVTEGHVQIEISLEAPDAGKREKADQWGVAEARRTTRSSSRRRPAFPRAAPGRLAPRRHPPRNLARARGAVYRGDGESQPVSRVSGQWCPRVGSLPTTMSGDPSDRQRAPGVAGEDRGTKRPRICRNKAAG